MCLGIPGKITEISDPKRKLAMVDISGIVGDEPLEALIGTWSLIHVGFAMSKIDEKEAALTLDVLRQLGEAQEEIEAMRASEEMLRATS